SLIALRAKVLVVQVIWSGIATGPVIVITGKHTVDDFCTVKDLLGFRCYFEFLTRIVFIIGFPNPVFNDVAGVRVVGNFALVRVIGHPLCGIEVGLLPDFAFFFGLVFYRTFDNVLGIGVVRDGEVIIIGICKAVFDTIRNIVCEDVVAQNHGVNGRAIGVLGGDVCV